MPFTALTGGELLQPVILVVCDGLGDRPCPSLNNLTPLQAARTPSLDALASRGICGLQHTIGRGIRPGSDVSHLAIFGYDPAVYYPGRGVFEVLGIGMGIGKGDVALRANVGTLSQDGVILDRRAGRIESVAELVKGLDGKVIRGVTFIVKPGLSHRAGIIMRGKGLSDAITEQDPHVTGVAPLSVKPKDSSKEAEFTAKVLNEFLEFAAEHLASHPLNREREKKGLPPANVMLVRGASEFHPVEPIHKRFSLKSACVAGAPLYKGVAKYVGMDIVDVEGATGLPTSNLSAKFSKALELIKSYDLVFVHIKAADNLAEDGNAVGKRDFIERIDKAASALLKADDALVVFTADHSTPCTMKAHSGDPVPIMFAGNGVRPDSVKAFDEISCAQGGLGHLKALDIIPEILNITGRAKLYGA